MNPTTATAEEHRVAAASRQRIVAAGALAVALNILAFWIGDATDATETSHG